jgi:hypothetical protein
MAREVEYSFQNVMAVYTSTGMRPWPAARTFSANEKYRLRSLSKGTKLSKFLIQAEYLLTAAA